MKIKKIVSVFCASAMFVSMISLPVGAEENDMRDITTMELVRDMGVGINLGNTLESCGDWIAQWGDGTVKSYETAWGSPEITKEMIQGYADEGFGVLRIPVAWTNLMSTDGTYTISDKYMARVQEIVDWTIDAGMYAIINIHYDNGWIKELPNNKEELMKKYTTMWTQIADNFKDYNDYLMFESQNEELGWDTLWNRWGGTEGKDVSYALVNEVNQTFVDVIRSSGGNNAERHLLISGYNTDIDLTCDDLFEMPEDSADRCAVSVHYYTPAGFAILEEDADWGKATSTWGTEQDFAELERNMGKMKTTFIDNGVPVIVGEYGCPKKNKDADSVRLFLSSVCETAYDNQLCPILWDITDVHYDRTNCEMIDPVLMDNFLSVLDEEQPPVETEPPVVTTEPTTETEPPVVTTEPPVEPEIIAGDINSDNVLDVRDVLLLKSYILGNIAAIDNGDVNADGVVTSADVVLLKNIVIG